MSSRANLPIHVKSVWDVLQFSSGNEGVPAFIDWDKVLGFCDCAQIALPFALRSRGRVPAAVQDQLEERLQKNASRWRRIKEAYGQVAAQLHTAQIDFAVLKGFTHCPAFVEDPRHRVQYDLDFLVQPAQLSLAYEAVRKLGYEPLRGFEDFPLDHLPAMVKKTGWK